MIDIICPVCSETLTDEGRSYICKNGHCFDKAKEGYVNLLIGKHKSGSEIGDNKDMAQNRREFLTKGYFDPLVCGITDYIKELSLPRTNIADICCGEGYYGHRIKEEIRCDMVGFDISKEMVRLASKRKNGITYFVGNLSKIPLRDGSIDIALHLFAPFHEKEFSRITSDEGYIISVVAGENHLIELKSILYDTPYKNDEEPPKTENLILSERRKITAKVHLETNEDIMALFKMTPYYYHTKDADKRKLSGIDGMDITVDFLVLTYRKS